MYIPQQLNMTVDSVENSFQHAILQGFISDDWERNVISLKSILKI